MVNTMEMTEKAVYSKSLLNTVEKSLFCNALPKVVRQQFCR